MNLAYGRYGGSTKGYYIPDAPGSTEQSVDLSFKGNLVDIGAQFELNHGATASALGTRSSRG